MKFIYASFMVIGFCFAVGASYGWGNSNLCIVEAVWEGLGVWLVTVLGAAGLQSLDGKGKKQ